jgi:AmmeMemoRadiSam system protein B
MPSNQFPKLRALDIRPIVHEGRPCFLLRDPMQLSDSMLTISQLLGPLLLLCDGTHDRDAIREKCAAYYGLPLDRNTVNVVLNTLDDALMFENERFFAARAAAVEAYRSAPFRVPFLAGQSYPADPDELRELLTEYLDEADDVETHTGALRGMLSPHIDYERGGHVYAAVWKRAAQAARAADLAVLFGTDHYGDRGRLTLTCQNYATPWGVLPTPTSMVDEIVAALGSQVLEHELRHCGEHSIELVATWLHFIRGGEPVELLPILVGSFGDFTRRGNGTPDQDEEMNALLDVLKRTTQGKRVLVVASGDMAHVGPAFDGQPLDQAGKRAIRASDDALLGCMESGDAQGFFKAIQRIGDENNICGLPPLYLALRLLGATTGERVAYDQCPADDHDTSIVSVGGAVFT